MFAEESSAFSLELAWLYALEKSQIEKGKRKIIHVNAEACVEVQLDAIS